MQGERKAGFTHPSHRAGAGRDCAAAPCHAAISEPSPLPVSNGNSSFKLAMGCGIIYNDDHYEKSIMMVVI
jgi:hypothetical protein